MQRQNKGRKMSNLVMFYFSVESFSLRLKQPNELSLSLLFRTNPLNKVFDNVMHAFSIFAIGQSINDRRRWKYFKQFLLVFGKDS